MKIWWLCVCVYVYVHVLVKENTFYNCITFPVAAKAD